MKKQRAEYEENEEVQVFDESRKRWLKARIAYYTGRTPTDLHQFMCTLRDGRMGNFDSQHIRRVK